MGVVFYINQKINVQRLGTFSNTKTKKEKMQLFKIQ